jgi:hypothetical protein
MIDVILGIICLAISIIYIVNSKIDKKFLDEEILLIMVICLISFLMIEESVINMKRQSEREIVLKKLIEDDKIIVSVRDNNFDYCLKDSNLVKTFKYLTEKEK